MTILSPNTNQSMIRTCRTPFVYSSFNSLAVNTFSLTPKDLWSTPGDFTFIFSISSFSYCQFKVSSISFVLKSGGLVHLPFAHRFPEWFLNITCRPPLLNSFQFNFHIKHTSNFQFSFCFILFQLILKKSAWRWLDNRNVAAQPLQYSQNFSHSNPLIRLAPCIGCRSQGRSNF